MKKHILPIVIIIAMVSCGYYLFIFGGHCYLYQDPDEISYYSYKNSVGNGWWPDRGFGISAFFGDPGKWHSWSLFAFWEKIIRSREFAYGSSIALLNILAAISLYFVMMRIIPILGNIPASLLSVLVVFGPAQAPFSFNRIWIAGTAGTPLFLMLLYSYYKRPRVIHLFLAILLFFFTIFFGNIWSFNNLMSLGVLFSIIYWFYFRERFRRFLAKFILLYSIAGTGALLLGFWIFYSIFVDYCAAGGYMREKIINFSWKILSLPDIKSAIIYIASLFQVEWLPVNLRMIGVWGHDFLQSFNISVIFPVVFIFFLFRRSANFWEHAFKTILAVFYIFEALLLFPGICSIYSSICWLSTTVITMYGFENIFPLQIILIGIFLLEMKKRNFQINNLFGKTIQKTIAAPLFLLYSGLALFCLFALLSPGILPNAAAEFIGRFASGRVSASLKDVIYYVVSSNVSLAEKVMRWHSFAFFASAAFLMLLFFKDKWLKACSKRPLALITGVLALNAVLFSWAIYPLSKDINVWQKVAHLLPDFKPTDRFYFVNDVEGYQKQNQTQRLEEHKKRVEAAGGLQEHLAYKAGIYRPPGLHFSGHKHYTQKNVGEFIYHIFNQDGVKRIKNLRDLTTNGGPVFSSELLDMGAVSYYYSTRKILNMPKNLSPYVETGHMYIYKNLSSWPYFYLADKMETAQIDKRLRNVKQGTAYVAEKDLFELPMGKGNSTIELREFSSGRMVFDYNGDKENFLVVADAWHPFWKARIDGQGLPVVKANEIFKGVRLPRGEYRITLFFDTSPFFIGIYISVIAWVLFLMGLIFVIRSKREILFNAYF